MTHPVIIKAGLGIRCDFAGVVLRLRASAPIPKFAPHRGTLSCELRNQRDTSNFMILVRVLDLKFPHEFAAQLIGTSNPPHLEHFPERWTPAFRKKMRQASNLERFPPPACAISR